MNIVHIIGVFVFALAVAFGMERRKRNKGEETWEKKKGIPSLPKWATILIGIAGFVMIFGANFQFNFFDKQYSFEHKGVDDIEEEKEDDKAQDENIAGKVNLGNGEVVIYDRSDEGYKTDDSYEGLIVLEKDNDSITYMNSFVEPDNEDGINAWKDIYASDEDCEYSEYEEKDLDGKPIYIAYQRYENWHSICVLEDIGAEYMLEIKITVNEIKNDDVMGVINNFLIPHE